MRLPAPLSAFLHHSLPAELELLRRMVAINSFTGNPDGVNRLGRLTAEAFAPWGFTAEFVPNRTPGTGQHLILTRPGRTDRTLALISHLDTVFPPEEEARNRFHWQPEGDRIYGPGTLDIKGGTMMIHWVLSALRSLAADAFEDVTWLCLLNSSEETLSQHFAEVCLNRFDRTTRAALVFEAEGRQDGLRRLVVARKGRATFRLTVAGRAAHAGSKHARGANAIVQLGRTVDQVAALSDPGRELTFNVGVVSGGVAVNRVPHEAVADVEMRAFDSPTYEAGKAALLALGGPGTVRSREDGYACRIGVEVLSESPPWPRNRATDALFEVFAGAGAALELPVGAEARGGLSDGNHLWHAVPTLDGLGPYGDNDHSSERSADATKLPEYIQVSSLVPKAALNFEAIQRLIGEGTSGLDA